MNLRHVKEIRDGRNSKEFDKNCGDLKIDKPTKCFVILYGNDFKLKTLSIEGMLFFICVCCFMLDIWGKNCENLKYFYSLPI